MNEKHNTDLLREEARNLEKDISNLVREFEKKTLLLNVKDYVERNKTPSVNNFISL